MIRIRNCNNEWQVRWRCYIGEKRTWHWGAIENLDQLQQDIVEFAVHLDNYIRIALEVMRGESATYLYCNGELKRRKPLDLRPSSSGIYPCYTMLLRHHSEVKTTIQLIESGIWKVRKWTPPASFSERTEHYFSQEKIKQQYLIIETRDDGFIPFEVII
jgi:hypothetical protein